VSDKPEAKVSVQMMVNLNVTPRLLAWFLRHAEDEAGTDLSLPDANTDLAPAPGLLGLGARIEHPDQAELTLTPEEELFEEQPASVEPPAPAKHLRAAPRPVRAKVNGKSPAESPAAVAETPPPLPVEPVVVMPPEPEAPMGLEDIRSLLKQMSAAVPGRDATVLKMIEEVGGGLRVSECPVEKWPAIVAAARAAIAAHSG
jgi:hypothetical protein